MGRAIPLSPSVILWPGRYENGKKTLLIRFAIKRRIPYKKLIIAKFKFFETPINKWILRSVRTSTQYRHNSCHQVWQYFIRPSSIQQDRKCTQNVTPLPDLSTDCVLSWFYAAVLQISNTADLRHCLQKFTYIYQKLSWWRYRCIETKDHSPLHGLYNVHWMQ